jgi:hypothetical protein
MAYINTLFKGNSVITTSFSDRTYSNIHQTNILVLPSLRVPFIDASCNINLFHVNTELNEILNNTKLLIETEYF